MSRVRAFFLEEATECLRIAGDELGREVPARTVVYRAVRRLRGSAQLARAEPLAGRAAALEERLRPRGADRTWSPALAGEVRTGLEELKAALGALRRGRATPEERTRQTMEGETEGGAVGMEELEYRGQAALERALELRQHVEDAIVSEVPVGPILDELFDLIRLGMA